MTERAAVEGVGPWTEQERRAIRVLWAPENARLTVAEARALIEADEAPTP